MVIRRPSGETPILANSIPSLRFRKPGYSSGQGQNFVEVADLPTGSAAVRDSERPGAGHLTFSAAEWSALLRADEHT
ncbi:DUF397 domain-containing protein [Nocardiopsis sp. CC223A]|uniref:DUF397 domain-containing protein n=1 Tax=Nocardiopsis sp. CC223A TaxID=3044051 RepID=UPI00278C843D|nr:DUF397 domain-containing protein [Nocardiopsis sp. CC223A]